MSVIFLSGVHGVGKGFLGAPVANSMGIAHFTASQLIREEKGQATWGTDKKTFDLDDNQLALIRAVDQKRSSHPCILLDGHFVLRDSEGVLTPLATAVFKELHLTGVILLSEESNIIASRLTMRDKGTPDVQAISELADAELTHAQVVCRELGVPLKVLNKPTEISVGDAITQLRLVLDNSPHRELTAMKTS
jgi:adenylate kinase